MTNQLESLLEDIIQGEETDDKQIVMMNDETIQISTQTYTILVNYREGFDIEAFKLRYQPFFEKFDFIVGDWGHEQLRLRGFYQLGKRKVPRDQQIDFLDDYIKEYCNFGAAYFVLGKVEAVEKYNKLINSETNTKKDTKRMNKPRPKPPHVSTPTNDSQDDRFDYRTKKNNRKKSFKKTEAKQGQTKAKKLTEKTRNKEINDKKFVIKKVQKNT